MVWSYFGSSRGKGVHDVVGAILKQKIRKEQLNMECRTQFQCVTDVVVFYNRK
jgi:hypothetical protein